MKIALAALAAVGALACAPVAAADDSAADLRIGQAGTLVNGDVVQTWTVSGLRTSADVIPGDVIGTLWEATATNAAVEGTVIPIIPNFNARAGSANYRVLFGVASPQGINPSTLSAGEKASGKIYFDIPSGVSPDRVVFNDGQVDKLVWVNAPEPVAASPGGRPATPQATRPAAVPATPAQSPASVSPPAPAAGTPATSQGTPAATSQGTPAASAGTPAPPAAASSAAPAAGTPATSPGVPAATSQGTPATEGTPAAPTAPTAPASPVTSPGTPAATSQGTPATEGTPAAPAAASPVTSPGVPAGTSQGTPASPGIPAAPTTVIPPPTPGATSAGTAAG